MTRTRLVLVPLIFASLLALTSCKPNDGRQQLLREASMAWETAQGITSTEPEGLVAKWEALADVQDRLRQIMRLYPESSTATALAKGDVFDGIRVLDVQERFRFVSDRIQNCAECQLELFLAEARRIEDEPNRLSALLAVAEVFPSSRVFLEAYALADGIHGYLDSADAHDVSIREVIDAAAKAGFPEIAFSAIEALDSQDRQAVQTFDIARAQADAGYIEEAMATLDIAHKTGMSLSNPDDDRLHVSDALARGAIARALALEGRHEEAAAMLESIERADVRSKVLLEISEISADEDKSEQGTALAETLPTESARSFGGYGNDTSLERVAAARARSGQVDAAIDFVESIPDASVKTKALGAVAVAQAESGSFEAALATAKRVEDWYRPVVLSRIAIVQAEAGLVPSAIDLVLDIGDTGPDPRSTTSVPAWDERPNAYKAIAIAQAREGDWSAALETARGIADQWPFSDRVEALAELGRLRSDPELFDEAFAYAADARQRFGMDYVVEAEASAGYWMSAMTRVRLSYPVVFEEKERPYDSVDQLEALRAVLHGLKD